jgi:hypothetical protein
MTYEPLNSKTSSVAKVILIYKTDLMLYGIILKESKTNAK